jgi:hypothetical protein
VRKMSCEHREAMFKDGGANRARMRIANLPIPERRPPRLQANEVPRRLTRRLLTMPCAINSALNFDTQPSAMDCLLRLQLCANLSVLVRIAMYVDVKIAGFEGGVLGIA